MAGDALTSLSGRCPGGSIATGRRRPVAMERDLMSLSNLAAVLADLRSIESFLAADCSRGEKQKAAWHLLEALKSSRWLDGVDVPVDVIHRMEELGKRVHWLYLAPPEPGSNEHRETQAFIKDTIKLLTENRDDPFADLPPKPRKLLLALNGKGKVPIKTAFLAVYDRKTLDNRARQTFLTLVRRTENDLQKKHKLMIRKDAETLELLPLGTSHAGRT
jgi:hypothetical protein